jgi:hypothetical protein
MVVVPIHERDADRRTGERPRRFEPAKAAADDYDVRHRYSCT